MHFQPGVVMADSYLNDIRFDLRRGTGGIAYITDSSMNPDHAGLVVVDLGTGQSWRRLTGHDSVRGERTFVAMLDGKPVLLHRKGEMPKEATVGADGIAISADGNRLFYCPLSSRKIYSVSTEALANRQLSDADVARTVQEEKREFASDGLESDAEGRLYLTDWEHNAIEIRTAPNHFETLVSDPRMVWPDTLSLADDGYLYFTANQLNRTPTFNGGEDRRQMPFYLFRIRVDAKPVRLGS
jgi:sugar lactone lactonase YvrE